jgi:hypothetical protein
MWKNRVDLPMVVPIGLSLGLLMTLIDHLPLIVTGEFSLGYEPMTINIMGRLSYTGIMVGLAEESIFRGFLQGSLMEKNEPTFNLPGLKLYQSNIIASLIYGASHLLNIFSKSFSYVLPQIIYTTILGTILGYLYRSNGRLVNPIITHNLSNGVETTLEYLIYLTQK